VNGTSAPVIRGSDVLSTPLIPGPHADTTAPIVVSLTDFRAHSEDDYPQIFKIGMELSRSWPIMQGAVGLWLWGKQAELRGGSLSVWDGKADLARFVRWPAHVAIMRDWRDRVDVLVYSWEAETFDSEAIWTRAETYMHRARARTP
jgi:hypothetical protein